MLAGASIFGQVYMGIRVQPREVLIPDDDSFKNDLLERKDKAEILTSLVSNIDGPCTMAVDAAWGAGKTTFLKMWAQHLRNEGLPVVEFNAWETDASGNPFLALTTEITEQLKRRADSDVVSKVHQTQFLAKKLLRRVAPGAIRTASGFIPVVGVEVGHILSSHASEAMAGYFEEKESAAQFKSSLERLSEALWQFSGHKPTIILIDELDRCRPTYAIELLETAKHIFGVDHVVFVLAVNRAELAHSVKVLYGSNFDAEGYLRRFFDIDFRLPSPDRTAFIKNTLTVHGVQEFLQNSPDKFANNQLMALKALTKLLAQSNMTLRDIAQALNRLNVVLSSLGNHEHAYFSTLTVLAVISATNPSLYRQFLERSISAEAAIDALFQEPPFTERRPSSEGILVESVLIAARMSEKDFGPSTTLEERKAKYPLYSYYADIVEGARSSGGRPSEEHLHANIICENVARFHLGDFGRNEPLGFEETVQRFELLSPDLKEAAT